MNIWKYEITGLEAFGITLGLIAMIEGSMLFKYVACLILVAACVWILIYQRRQDQRRHRKYQRDIKNLKRLYHE